MHEAREGDGHVSSDEPIQPPFLRESQSVLVVRDESEPITRVADAVAGFVRDFIEGQAYAPELYEKAVASGVLREL